MKKPFLINDSKKSVIPQDGALYVTLPTDISVGGAVYINVPAFETTTNRRDIMVTDPIKDATTWNAGIAALVFGKEGVFVKLFNSFTKEYKKTIANYAFLYVPLELYKELYKKFNKDFRNVCSSLSLGFEELEFIPCRTSSGIQMRSLQEVRNPKIYRLKAYMYQWFDLMDPDFERFYQNKANEEIEFIYMKNENEWDLINEFKKHNELQPNNEEYGDAEFFRYIAYYWESYYENMDVQQKEECERDLIKKIASITGVENHYSNWCVWKKFYLESSEDRTGIINNMITAVCFDCEDFDRAFYFTSGDIEKIIKKDNPDEQLNIQEDTVGTYKEKLKEKKYFDFKPYFERLKFELINYKSTEELLKLQLICQKFAVENYTGNKLVEVTKDISEQNILKSIYDKGVKTLEALREELPVLLITGGFREPDSQDFFLQLPACLFKENSSDLIENSEYDELLMMWKKNECIVSRENISQRGSIKALGQIKDLELEKLIPNLEYSKKYFKLIWKNKLLNKDIVNNLLKFWKKKIDGEIEKVDYFSLYVEALGDILKYNNSSEQGIDIDEPEIKYDSKLLKGNEKVKVFPCNNCNKLEESVFIINLSKDIYKNNPVDYWNEIEVDLTSNQRKCIVEKWKENEFVNDDEVENGIEDFLNHIYMCSEEPYSFSGYPFGQYLRVYVEGQESFVIFKDYTDSLLLLLKEKFGIGLKKSKFKPFVNLYKYNELLPIGDQKDYIVVKDYVFEILKKITDKDEVKNIKMQLLSLQYQLSDNKLIAGYGMQCPFLKTNDVTELSSLQIFEYALFGFHIGISLYGSKSAKDVIIKYASSIQVSIQKKNVKIKKVKEYPLFLVDGEKYRFNNQEPISRKDITKNEGNKTKILERLIKILDDVNNNIIIDIEMVTDKGTTKNERFKLQLTHCHRALMVYELTSAISTPEAECTYGSAQTAKLTIAP